MLTSEDHPVLADPAQVQQVIMHLCTNAYHAMQANGGTLDITLAEVDVTGAEAAQQLDMQAGRHAKLTVRDRGCGMDAATQKRMFEPFFTTKGEGRGPGLGLASVHGIIKSHGGAIVVQSEVGAVTCIDVYLPLSPPTSGFRPPTSAAILRRCKPPAILIMAASQPPWPPRPAALP